MHNCLIMTSKNTWRVIMTSLIFNYAIMTSRINNGVMVAKTPKHNTDLCLPWRAAPWFSVTSRWRTWAARREKSRRPCLNTCQILGWISGQSSASWRLEVAKFSKKVPEPVTRLQNQPELPQAHGVVKTRVKAA